MNFNKNEFDCFRSDVVEVLAVVAKKYGVIIDTGNIRYTDLEFKMELKVTKNDLNLNVEQEKFIRECVYYGFKPEHYNIEFMAQGKPFRLVGFNSNKPKNNCNIVSSIDGKQYMCNDESIKRALRMN